MLVARTISVYLPSVAFQSTCHGRKPYWVGRPPSLAGFQVCPPSVETSTLRTGELFDQAVPWMRTGPGLAHPLGAAMTDFTPRSVTGTISDKSTAVPGATECDGCRYADFIQKPSNS